MGLIVTVYKANGNKERRVHGHLGGSCHKATLPYERREAPGTTTKTPTADACREPEQTIDTKVKA